MKLFSLSLGLSILLIMLVGCNPTQNISQSINITALPSATVSALPPTTVQITPTAAPVEGISSTPATEIRAPIEFDGARAFEHAAAQIAFGPRPVGSAAARETANYIFTQLRETGWQTEVQEFEHLGLTARNLIGRNALGQGPVVILGAHYDTRFEADQDRSAPTTPVLGANDGASGVSVLLELARALDIDSLHNEVWLAFFDAEDNGGLRGWDWIVGSTYMASELSIDPLVVIVVDMIGDADQQIYFDHNSDSEWSAQIWAIAAELGFQDYFIAEYKYAMLDDHTPFAREGIPAVDIIDFDYHHWHTTSDTLDKLSAESLERVGRTLEQLLENR